MKTRHWTSWVVTLAMSGAAAASAFAGPQIDSSPDRAKTPLNPGLKHRATAEITVSVHEKNQFWFNAGSHQ